MAHATLQIADLRVRYSGADSVVRAMHIPGMPEFAVPEAAPDIEVRLDEPLAAPDCQWIHHFDIADGNATCRVGLAPDGTYCYLFGSDSILLYNELTPNLVRLNAMTEASHLRFALWVAYALAGLRRGRVPVHSSVVVHRGRAVLCLGESGTGKSTHTRLWLKHIDGCHLLNDDSPIVTLRDGIATAYGSPWSGKTHCYRPEHFPIAALLRLEQRPEKHHPPPRHRRILRRPPALMPPHLRQGRALDGPPLQLHLRHHRPRAGFPPRLPARRGRRPPQP